MPDRTATMRAAGDYLASRHVERSIKPKWFAVVAGLALSILGVLFFFWSNSFDELEASIIMAIGGFFLLIGAPLLSFGIVGRLKYGVAQISKYPIESLDPVDRIIQGLNEHHIWAIVLGLIILVLAIALLL